MNEFPMIRLTVEGMKHSIVHALSSYEADLQDQIRDGVASVVDGFDFKALVQECVHTELRKVVSEAVRSAVNEAARHIADEAADQAIKAVLK